MYFVFTYDNHVTIHTFGDDVSLGDFLAKLHDSTKNLEFVKLEYANANLVDFTWKTNKVLIIKGDTILPKVKTVVEL